MKRWSSNQILASDSALYQSFICRLFGAVPSTLKEVSGVSAAPTPAYEFANGPEIASLLNPAPAPEQPNPGCPLLLCKVTSDAPICPFKAVRANQKALCLSAALHIVHVARLFACYIQTSVSLLAKQMRQAQDFCILAADASSSRGCMR